MPTQNLFGSFVLKALRPNGTGVASARIRVFDADSNEVTATLFGGGQIVTDSSGFYTKVIGLSSRVPINQVPINQVYNIQVTAPGYSLWQAFTNASFTGPGEFTANLTQQPAQTNYTITEPPAGPLSSMVPILCEVESPNDFDWEIIAATVTHPDNKTSIIQAPVDKATGTARLDIRNRVQLGVRPLLVGGTALSLPDTDFSTSVEVTFRSINPEGETVINGSFTRLVAHTLPPGGQTDLSDYVSATDRSWIVPADPVLAFIGCYRDVMLWLPITGEGASYVLTATYYNAEESLLTTETADLTESDYVQRIRLNTDPAATCTKARLSVTADGAILTKPLTILYRD
ncbi:hypothetical protein [Spirosoma arcticum]